MRRQHLLSTELAAIEYLGQPGNTASCIKAVARVLQDREVLSPVYLLTAGSRHAFLIRTFPDYPLAIKAGFASGYGGEGPRGLSRAITLFEQHQLEIEEYDIKESMLDRINQSCVLREDENWIRSARPCRPTRIESYLFDSEIRSGPEHPTLTRDYPSSLPLRLIDSRIMDLAVTFSDNPDTAIIRAFRRLEDTVRQRCGLNGESGSRLFTQAFLRDGSPLTWKVEDPAESKGRGQLFIGTYMAFRNARAHREVNFTWEEAAREFLLVNELFHLESKAVEQPSPASNTKTS